MKSMFCWACALPLIFLLDMAFADPTHKPPRPNILIFVLDDVGFGHLGSFGGPISTPHIDSVARKGLRYTNFHTTSLCSPTRAALLTGRNHHSAGTGVITEISTKEPGYTGIIPKDKALFAEVLKLHGYRTGAFGKWHNTPTKEISPHGPFDHWPTHLGFDYFYGFQGGEISQWEPTVWENTTPVHPPIQKENYHFTEDMTEKAINWLKKSSSSNKPNNSKPFFLYYATGAVHAPHHAPAAYINKYKGKFNQGWDQIRAETFARQKAMGLFPEDAQLPARLNEVEAWDDLPENQKELYARMQEIFAGFLEHTDAQFGKILKSLKDTGELDNTLIFILSDNGASAEGGPSGSYNEMRYFNGIPESLEMNLSHMRELGTKYSFNHYPAGWAMAGNTPFRYFKQLTHEGGVRDPMIVSWTGVGGIKGKGQGEIRNQFIHVNDIASTLYDILKITPPKEIKGVQQKPLEGASFKTSFLGAKVPTAKKVQYFEMLGNLGIWNEGWKAVTFHGRLPWTGLPNSDFDQDQWELYDLQADPTESRDLSLIYPQKVREMKELFHQEALKYQVYPLNDSTVARIQATIAGPVGNKKIFNYTQKDYQIHEYLAPPIKNKSFKLITDVEIPEDTEEGVKGGVLFAEGGRAAGITLFIKDGRPHFNYNFLGDETTQIVGNKFLTPGKNRIELTYRKLPGGKARVEMFLEGNLVGKARIEHTLPFVFSGVETFDVGRDTGSPASEEYEAPFIFDGKITTLRFEILDDI